MTKDLIFFNPNNAASLWLRKTQKDVADLFEDFVDSACYKGGGKQLLSARVDIIESDSAYKFIFEVPGVSESDLSIKVRCHNLEIHGEKGETHKADGDHLHLVERSWGAFSRSIRLPEDCDTDAISAVVKDGLLIVTATKRKSDSSNAKEIRVKKA